MQSYVVLMVILVIAGTVLDMMHKKSAQYFFENSKKAQKAAKRNVGAATKAGLAISTVANEVLTSAEFNNQKRRMSHLLTMYGFILFVATSAVLIFKYPAENGPALVSLLWHLGAVMLCYGGLWFWLFIRVDVLAEGVKWHNFICCNIVDFSSVVHPDQQVLPRYLIPLACWLIWHLFTIHIPIRHA